MNKRSVLLLSPSPGRSHLSSSPAEIICILEVECTARTIYLSDKILLSFVSLASQYSTVGSIPSGSGTTPIALPCAPLTIPRRVEMFERTAVGMFCVYISRPGPLTLEPSCTSNNLSTSTLRVPLAFFQRVWRAGKTNIF
jgi:hypothetical protein